MSIKVMSYVWDIPQFKGSDKLVMLCLADHADEHGLCWPSIETIARKSGVSATTVKSTLKKLETGGWVAKKHQFKKSGSGRLVRASNQYRLPVLLLKKKADQQQTDQQPIFDGSKTEQSKPPQGVGQISPQGRSRSDHKPSIDPPIDPPILPAELEWSNKVADKERVYCEIPLKGKQTHHAITQSQIEQLSQLYPAVDVDQQLRNMIGWCQANPQRKKTKQGINRFIHAWLCKEQNKGCAPSARGTMTPDFNNGDTDWAQSLSLGGEQ
ncbi:helix-turn-helix domain-containing protein [Vibrio ostreicida]|uniref:helix-turn-helix domain-containing protein n=1 Tax=Vibrio ostreicida TaxID=526588 RepID=UPI003B58EFD8